jgi:uncharacterized protein YndB with AHSA1/START domain
MTEMTDTAVRHQVTIDVPREHAFNVFVEHRFANPDHHLLDADMERAAIEPRAGGRWYERAVDGRECDWGRVLAYEPPERIVLSWQITPEFTPEPDPEKASEVEVRFIAESEERTRVELVHSRLERHGEAWEVMRAAVDSPDGWPGELQRYAARALQG